MIGSKQARKIKPKKVCRIDGCERTGKIRRGLCGKHYQRWLNHGDPHIVLRRLGFGESAAKDLYRFYKLNAKNRGIEWEITQNQFRELTSQNCFYCDIEPQREFGANGSKSYYGAYTYNGIDRVDSNKGYIIENCVACCSFCNWGKNAMSVDEFLDNIARAYCFQAQQIEYT